MKNIFTPEVSNDVVNRINKLSENSTPGWGEMNVGQMLAHCCVPYEYIFEGTHQKPNPLMKFFLKSFVKKFVVTEVPFKRNIRTAPDFLMTGEKDFNNEKNRLINYIKRTQELGETHFDGKESHSFGKLSKDEWNNMFYKHLDHHLTQFAV